MSPPRSSTAPVAGPQHVPVGKFKAKVAAYLRAIERTGGTLVVTNRGRPIATITSAFRRPGNTFVGSGRGAIRVPDGATFPMTHASWSALPPSDTADTPELPAAPAPDSATGEDALTHPSNASPTATTDPGDARL